MKSWIRSNEKMIYRMINAGALAGGVLLGSEGFLGTGEMDGGRWLTALAVLALFAALNFMAVRGRVLCLAALFVILATGVSAAGVGNSFAFLESFFPWLLGSRTAPEEWVMGYGLVQTGLLAGMSYLIQVLFEKAPPLKTAAAVLALVMMAFCLFTRRELNHYGVAFLLCFCVIAWVEWIQDHWKKQRGGRGSREAHTLWILPFFVLYLVLMAAMPAPGKPYGWLWAKNIYWKLRENILTYTRNIKWGSREGFGMAFSGFSESGEVGGDLQEESSVIMRISIGGGFSGYVTENIYLTGRVYDTFDGRGWYQNWQGYPGEVFLDTAELLYAVRAYNERYQQDYLREVSLEICYEDFNTGYAFAPLKTWSIEDGTVRGLPGYICSGGSLRWTEQKGYGTEYGLRYFRMNAGQQEFDLFLEEVLGNGGEGLEENEGIWAQVLRECKSRNGEEFTWDDMALYRQGIYGNYLGEAELSPEVRSYLQEITGNAVTDMEKLRAIEGALQNFSYTLTPGELPEQVEEAGDFLDYFLLESRQGYCTYFATAFVLLARAEGIPARYVQGYCVPAAAGEVIVDSSMAHAWPEVYLEGAGWIPFEPTPGYGEKRYASWGLRQKEEEYPAEGQDGTMVPYLEPDRETEVSEIEENEGESGGTGAEEEKKNTSRLWRKLMTAVPLLLAVCAMLSVLDNMVSRYRYRRKPRERFQIEVFRNLEILSMFGVRRKDWETLQELQEKVELLPGVAGKIEEGLPDTKVSTVICFIEDYERVIYGGEDVGEEMLEGVVRAKELLLGLLKKEKKWAYFYCRIRLFFGKNR